jgi:hypothetical protein
MELFMIVSSLAAMRSTPVDVKCISGWISFVVSLFLNWNFSATGLPKNMSLFFSIDSWGVRESNEYVYADLLIFKGIESEGRGSEIFRWIVIPKFFGLHLNVSCYDWVLDHLEFKH